MTYITIQKFGVRKIFKHFFERNLTKAPFSWTYTVQMVILWKIITI